MRSPVVVALAIVMAAVLVCSSCSAGYDEAKSLARGPSPSASTSASPSATPSASPSASTPLAAPAARSLITQMSDTLFVIRLGSGELVEFADNDGGTWETSWKYRYESYLDRIAAHLISIMYYEGRGYLLIGAARGDTTMVDARPVISPSATHFITASSGGEAGYDPTRIRIWRVAPEGFTMVLSHETEDWGFSNPAWHREDSITVVRHAWSEENYPDTIQDQLSIVLRQRQWIISDPITK